MYVVCVELCLYWSLPGALHANINKGHCGGGHTYSCDPWGSQEACVVVIAQESQIKEQQCMLGVLCLCLKACMNPPFQLVCKLGACKQAYCACMRVCGCVCCVCCAWCRSSITGWAVCPWLGWCAADNCVYISVTTHRRGNPCVHSTNIASYLPPGLYTTDNGR